jgi:transposase
MREAGLDDVPVVVGGIIPPQDASALKDAGVAEVYTPKDFELNRIMSDLRAASSTQARRLLAIAAVLEGASREDAAKMGGMDRQTLRDWVLRFNEQGPDGLINIPSPGMPPKLGKKHRAFLARLVEEGPIPAVDGVVRWRACDLIMRLYEEFRLSVSDDTVYRALKDLGFSHVSARPKAYKQDADAMEAFKKTLPTAWRKSVPSSRRVHL